tara:strand:+ start:172 stop:420 length:249 start_codon:yes stop_codon:yes gene_type:complete
MTAHPESANKKTGSIMNNKDAIERMHQRVGFLSYLPEPVTQDLDRAVDDYLESEKSRLNKAIDTGVQALPLWLRSIARSALR